MKKCISLFIFVSIFYSTGFTQTLDPNLSFDKLLHDFGTIKEVDGKVTYDFEFTNTGGRPLIISQVRASCGCTAPDWSKEPVLPGKKGFVSATYDTRNRPGPFNKSLAVISNATTPNVVLQIKGDVIPKPKSIEDIYRYNMGSIRLVSNHMSFAQIKKDQTKTQLMEIINVSDQPVKVDFNRVPGHITIKAVPETLKPDEKGRIEASYNTKLKDDWGFVIDRIDVMLNDVFQGNNRLTISATIEEDFKSWSPEQLANAPSISFDNTTFNFKDVQQGEKVEHVFTITNNGKSDLIIRKVTASCGCTAVTPADEIIKSGMSTSLKVVFNSAGRIGNQNKTITIISNDPKKARTILWVKGTILKS